MKINKINPFAVLQNNFVVSSNAFSGVSLPEAISNSCYRNIISMKKDAKKVKPIAIIAPEYRRT